VTAGAGDDAGLAAIGRRGRQAARSVARDPAATVPVSSLHVRHPSHAVIGRGVSLGRDVAIGPYACLETACRSATEPSSKRTWSLVQASR
jgi:hypothetical protein